MSGLPDGAGHGPASAGEGRQVTGHDLVRPDLLPANVGFSARLEDLAASDLIITMLPDGAAVRGVVDRLLDEGCAAAVIDMSHRTPMTPGRWRKRRTRAVLCRCAGVGRCVPRDIGELMIMAGGTDEAWRRRCPLPGTAGISARRDAAMR